MTLSPHLLTEQPNLYCWPHGRDILKECSGAQKSRKDPVAVELL